MPNYAHKKTLDFNGMGKPPIKKQTPTMCPIWRGKSTEKEEVRKDLTGNAFSDSLSR
jgi:hypothetical protein